MINTTSKIKLSQKYVAKASVRVLSNLYHSLCLHFLSFLSLQTRRSFIYRYDIDRSAYLE